MENENKEYLEFAKGIAYEAGKIMLRYFNQDNGSSYKGDKTIVTIADTEINSYLIEQVKKEYPNHSVDGEEEQFGRSNFVWVCDPVDGTAMYARHIPVAVFSLALVIDGIPNVGVGSIIRACMCVASGDFTLAIFPGTKHKNCDIAAVKVNEKVHDEVVNTIKKYLILN